MGKTLLIFLFLFCRVSSAWAQEVSFKDTVAAYNARRIAINKRGMKVLGAWGIANVAAGGVGYFTAIQDEWRYFHEMNAAWGIVNTGIAALGLRNSIREERIKYGSVKAYKKYLSDKRLYLISSAVDVAYIGAGIGLMKYGETSSNNPATYTGFGKAVALQGIFLLLFDNVMFATQLRNNSKWYILMDEIRFTGSGLSYIHQF